MIKTEISNYGQRPPELDQDILAPIRESVRDGLQIDFRTRDPKEAALFLESVSRSFFYASRFLGIPGVDFRLGNGIAGNKKYLAKADILVAEEGVEEGISLKMGEKPEVKGVITFNQDYVDARLMSFAEAQNIPLLWPYRMDLTPAEVTAHEAYHVWQLLAAPRRVRREASNALTADSWEGTLSERAAKNFSRLLVLNMTMAQHASENQFFGGQPPLSFVATNKPAEK